MLELRISIGSFEVTRGATAALVWGEARANREIFGLRPELRINITVSFSSKYAIVDDIVSVRDGGGVACNDETRRKIPVRSDIKSELAPMDD